MARLNIAMLSGEDNNQEQVAAQAVEDHLEVLGQQVEDDLLQAQQVQIQSDQEDAAVNDAVQATEDLLEEQQAAEEASERKEEVTQVALESIQRNAKNILKSIGMEANDLSTYRYKTDEEKKADGKTGEEAAKVTSSSIGDFIKKIWEKIKEVWFRIVDAIKGFFKNLFNASVGLKKRALAVKEAAKKLKGKTIPSDAKFEAPESVQANMRMDYTAIPSSSVDRGLAKQNETITKFISNLTSKQALSRYEATVGDLAKSIAENSVGKNDKTLSENQEIQKEQTRLVNLAMEPILVYFPQKNGIKVGTPAFISDRVITLDTTNLTVGIEKIEGDKDLKGQHDPLELFQVENVCDVVAKQMDEYKGLDNAAEDFKKFSKEIEKIQSDLINQKKDVPFITRKMQAMVAATATRFFMNVVKTVATQARVIDMQVNKAAIDWCAASLKLYK